MSKLLIHLMHAFSCYMHREVFMTVSTASLHPPLPQMVILFRTVAHYC